MACWWYDDLSQAMQLGSIVPRQCNAITKQGKRCKRQAILGELQCVIHSRPSPKDPPSPKLSLAKIALDAFLSVIAKEGVKFVFEKIVEHLGNVSFSERRLFTRVRRKATTENLAQWFATLKPQSQQTILQAIKNSKKARYLSAGGSA